MSHTASRLIKNTAWLYGKIFVNMFVILLTTRIILNGLGATDFGIFNIVGGAITMLGFLNSTMAHATQRFMNYCEGEGNRQKLKQIFNVSILLHLGVALITGGVLTLCGLFFFEDILNIPVERLFAAKVVFGGLVVSTVFTMMTSPYEAVMNAHENFKYFAIVSVFENLLKLLIAIICLYSIGDKLIIYGVLMACIPFVVLGIMRYYCHKYYSECEFSPSMYYSSQIAKELTSFAGWNFIAATTSLIGHYGMGVILNHFFGVLLNAAQGIATQIGGAFMTLSANALKALTPILTKSEGANDRQAVYYMTLLGCRIPFFITALFSIPLFLWTPQILNIWLTEVPTWAVLFSRLQITKNVIDLLFRNLNSAIYAQGNIKLHSIAGSIIYIMPLLLAAIAFYYGYPPYFIYIIWIAINILGGFISLYICRLVTGLSISRFFIEVLIPCVFTLLISLLPSITVLLLYEGTHKIYNYIPVVSTIVFALLGWRFLLQQKERSMIINLAVQKSQQLSNIISKRTK